MIEKLIKIQSELKAPKSQFNSFGKYNYRNCEDILEAVKPLCYAQGLMLSLTDKLVHIDGEFFIEATAMVTDGEKSHAVSSLAGVDMNKKGMDKSQTVGSSSSYARKYALNGLFLIDDTKDSDATNKHGKDFNVTTEKAELLSNSEAFLKAAEAIKSGKFTVADIEKKYRLSPDVKNKLENL